MSIVAEELQVEYADPWGYPLVYVQLDMPIETLIALNPLLRIEQNAAGEFVFMSPVGMESSFRNSEISIQLGLWARSFGGRAFDSSGMFTLPSGAKRSPDASWLASERWDGLTKCQKKTFSPICPDFAVELRSESDRLKDLMAKMEEYLSNGVKLGWLIDPLRREVQIYRTGMEPELLQQPECISGDPTLPGFVLDLRTIWIDS
jgi:Uma2 family endonuclease